MKKENRQEGNRRPVLVSAGAGLLIFLGVLLANSFWTVGKPDIYRLLSDACIVPAALVGGVGVLAFAANGGLFAIFSYGFRQFFDHFRPSARNERYKSFYEYKQAKDEGRRPVGHMLITGIAFFLLSLLFSLIWRYSSAMQN